MYKFVFLIIMFAATAVAAPETDKANVFNKNMLENGGFEYGKTKWTASAGTFAVTTSSPMVGLVHATWDAAASADTLTSTAVTVPAGFYGRNGVASCVFTTASGTATHTIQAYDGSNILSSATITSSTTPTRASANFVMPSSGSVSLRVYANADEPSVAIDDCYLGPAEGYNIGNVSQAVLVGSAYYAATANCDWTLTSASFSDFGTDTDCPAPTVTTNVGPGTISTTDNNLPQFTVTNLPAGIYDVVITAMMSQGTAAAYTLSQISDGTTTSPTFAFNASNDTQESVAMRGQFTYTTAQSSVTFKVRAMSTTGTTNIANNSSVNGGSLSFVIYRYPSSSERVYSPDKLANSWSGYHDSTCSWSTASASLVTPSGDASCALTERSNSNFGTVTSYTSGGNNVPGIVFTPSRAGRYYVCAYPQGAGSTASTTTWKLWDLTNTLALQNESSGATNIYHRTAVCGILVASNTSQKTVELQIATTAGTLTMNSGANSASVVEWSIFQIDQSFPMPLIANSVTTSSSGVSKVEAANINCDSGSAITSQHGSWVSSVGNVSGGACAITLTADTFSAAPYCVVSPNAAFSSLGLILSVTASSATALSVDCEDDASTACTSYDFNILCMGAK